MLPFLVMLSLIQAQPANAATAAPPDEQPPVDIVVVARRRSCGVQLHGTLLSKSELDRYAREWSAGREVRVSVDPGTDDQCLAKIMFRLADHGVRRATFIEPQPPQ